ncbi:MAG TPA: thioesterase family protein [Pirellulaceae bacterium]|nr:thioesterase family protein [Pirellulaceae bacterium]
MSTAFITSRRVEFSDTDAAGIMHFVAFFRMMEQAEHDLLRSVGLSVISHETGGTLSWPRVAAKCEFQSAARFEDVLQIEVRISRLGTTSLTFAHHFALGGREVATGEITTVCCRMSATAPPQPMPIPADIAAKLRGFVV